VGLDLKNVAQALGGEIARHQVLAPGPGHSRQDRSLSITLSSSAPDGFVVYSFAGDDPIACKDYVRQKLGLTPFQVNGHRHSRVSDDAIDQALRAAVNGQHRQTSGHIIAAYDYQDAGGVLLYQVVRLHPKSFRHRKPDGSNGWLWQGNERRVIYRWPELIKYPDATIFITEGEKDADRIAGLSHCATTVASGEWTADCIKALAGRDCLILEDNDDTGRKKAHEAATALYGTAKTIRIVRLPDLPDKGDVSDWLDANPRRADKLADICFDAPIWKPNDTAAVSQALIQSSATFIAAYVPPDYLIDGLLQRRYCYSFTGRTGDGKTAIALLIAAHVGTGRSLAGREVERGRVLMFAGENPDDVRARWLAMSQQLDFDPETIRVYFVPGRFKVSDLIQKIRGEAAELGDMSLLIIDTSAAYFEGEDENSNVQLGAHASRMRGLGLPGGPTTIINCHPTKNATDDNLVPRGGGAFLAEVDGNLVCMRDDTVVRLHWQGKFRGPDFAPITFQLRSVSHERLRDTKNRVITTVIAEPLSDAAEQDLAKAARGDEDRLLQAVAAAPKTSMAALALALGWLTSKNEPHKSKVHRVLGRLKKEKLVTVERGEYMLTEKASKLLKKLTERPNAPAD
jgi:AAA domain